MHLQTRADSDILCVHSCILEYLNAYTLPPPLSQTKVFAVSCSTLCRATSQRGRYSSQGSAARKKPCHLFLIIARSSPSKTLPLTMAS